MTTSSRLYPNLYKDSVSLMTVTVQVTDVPGIDAGSVVMASATNVENLAQAGLGEFEVKPNDLVVAVRGTEEACAQALELADDSPVEVARPATTTVPPPRRPSPASRWPKPRTPT